MLHTSLEDEVVEGGGVGHHTGEETGQVGLHGDLGGSEEGLDLLILHASHR